VTADQANQILQAITVLEPLGEAIVKLVRDALVARAPDDWTALHAELLADEAILSSRLNPGG